MGVKNKDSRLEVIKMIISQQELGNQEELRAELAKFGYESTQTTLSRDLKQLKIVKGTNKDGKYVYLLPLANAYRRTSDTYATLAALHNIGISAVRFSGNMAVIHTLPGHASHVSLDIDNLHAPEVLGTVAGDDTIILVMPEGTSRRALLNRLTTAGLYNPNSEQRFY